MERITYRPTPGSVRGAIDVRLGDKFTGRIKRVNGGWHYWPKGAKNPSETFPTIEELKRSLEGTDEQENTLPKERLEYLRGELRAERML